MFLSLPTNVKREEDPLLMLRGWTLSEEAAAPLSLSWLPVGGGGIGGKLDTRGSGNG